MKRIRFTLAELDVIITMVGIADAGAGDGDYEPWTDKDWNALETLCAKAAALREKCKGSTDATR